MLFSISELHQGFFSYVIRLISFCLSHENFQPYLVLNPTQTKGPHMQWLVKMVNIACQEGKKSTWRLTQNLPPIPTPPSTLGNEHT